MAKGLAVIIVLCVLTGLAPLLPGPGTAGGGMANEGIIMPGKGVDRFSIGAPAPDERKLRAIAQTEGVIIATANGSIRRITVSSPRHTVARSRLRPGAHLSEVLRFFGRGEKEITAPDSSMESFRSSRMFCRTAAQSTSLNSGVLRFRLMYSKRSVMSA